MNGSATPENAQSPVVVDVGDVEDGATRWWAVVLSVNGGWHATIRNTTGGLLHSPWSTTLKSERAFILSAKPNMSSDTTKHSPASFNSALRYLSEYCSLHGVEEQSQAALAAALLIPTANSGRKIIGLAVPQLSQQSPTQDERTPIPPAPIGGLRQLDRLLTLSCNAMGIKALLKSIFFEPGVTSNICGA